MKISISANCIKYNSNQIREHLLCQSTEKLHEIIERFSFAFTANAKRQAAACSKSKKIILF